jgi:outer membrane protein assembly factor BamD (BamD/ComL family)
MTASRPRRQTAADKRRAEIALIENSILAFERVLEKYPTDRFNEDRRRQMAMLQDKLATMTATA